MNKKQLRTFCVQFYYIDKSLSLKGSKYYYNFNEKCPPIVLEGKSISHVFEYSLNDLNKVIGFNYRMPQNADERTLILNKCLGDLTSTYYDFSRMLGKPFENISSSIRCIDDFICGYSFYFYPTFISNSGKVKMTGINRSEKCSSFLKELNSYYFYLEPQYEEEFEKFADICFELRGVSIYFEEKNFGYNIYIKCSQKELTSFLGERTLTAIQEGIILASMKISKGKILGYNVYYAGTHARPCCGWGEVID